MQRMKTYNLPVKVNTGIDRWQKVKNRMTQIIQVLVPEGAASGIKVSGATNSAAAGSAAGSAELAGISGVADPDVYTCIQKIKPASTMSPVHMCGFH